MAAKNTVEVTDGEVEDSMRRQAEDLAMLNDASGGDIFRAIDELRTTQGVILLITRITPSEKAGYCGSMPASEFSLEQVKKVYGWGRYQIRLKGPKGFLPGGGPCHIAESLVSENNPTDLASLLEIMDRRERERKAESSDKIGRIAELAIPLLGSVLTAFISRSSGPDLGMLITALKPAPGPTLGDLSQAMVNMKALNAPSGETKDPIETVLRIFEAAQDMKSGGANKGDTNWLDIVKEVVNQAGPAVGPVLAGLQQAAAARAAASQGNVPRVTVSASASAPQLSAVPPVLNGSAGPAGVLSPESTTNGVAATNGGTQNGSGQVDMLKLAEPMIRAKLALAAKWAVADRDPVTYAQVFLDELPSNIASFISQQQALEYLVHPDWFKVICEREPALTPYQEWCDEFRMELIEILKPQSQPERESETSDEILD